MLITVIHNTQDKVRATSLKKEMESQGLKPNEYNIIGAIMNSGTPAVGIMQSHKKCIEFAKQQGANRVCILEDDVKFLAPNTLSMLFYNATVLKTITEYDILIAGMYDGTPEYIEACPSVVKVRDKFSGLFCYVIQSNFYDRFLEAEEPYQLDFWLHHMGKAQVFCVYPMIAIQHDGYSYNRKEITRYNEWLHTKYKLFNS